MRAIVFTFDGFADFPGFAQGTEWSGFDNVSVTPETREAIVATFAVEYPDDAEGIASIPVGADGLVSLAGHYATRIVEH